MNPVMDLWGIKEWSDWFIVLLLSWHCVIAILITWCSITSQITSFHSLWIMQLRPYYESFRLSFRICSWNISTHIPKIYKTHPLVHSKSQPLSKMSDQHHGESHQTTSEVSPAHHGHHDQVHSQIKESHHVKEEKKHEKEEHKDKDVLKESSEGGHHKLHTK